MVRITVKKRYGAATVRAAISAPTVERALERAGEGATLLLPPPGGAENAPVPRRPRGERIPALV